MGVHAAVGQGGLGGFHLQAALVGHIAGAHSEERMAQEDLPGVAPQLQPLEDGEIAHTAVAAEVLELVEEDVEELSGAGMEVDGVGDAFLDGGNVGGSEMGHAETVFGIPHGSEVAQQGGIDGVARGGDGVEGIVADFAPLLAQLFFAYIQMDVVAVLDKAVVTVEVGVSVGGGCRQRTGGEGTETVVVVEVVCREGSRRQEDDGQGGSGGATQAARHPPSVGEKEHHGGDDQDDVGGVGMDEHEEE